MTEQKQGNGTMRTVGILGIIGALAFVGYQYTPINPVNGAKSAVQATLSDPSSALFQNMRRSTTAAGEVYCGEVNARNRFGGMVGYKRFYARKVSVSNSWLVFYAEDHYQRWEEFCG